MAKKKSVKKSGKKISTEVSPEKTSITILPDVNPDTPDYYVNFASVSHSQYDFTMTVLRIPSQLTAEQTELARAEKPVPVEPLLQLVLPPRLIGGLIRALTVQKRKYEETFGQIREDDKESNDKAS